MSNSKDMKYWVKPILMMLITIPLSLGIWALGEVQWMYTLLILTSISVCLMIFIAIMEHKEKRRSE